MPADSKHSSYEHGAAKWARCRDAVAGQDAVHAAGEKYLPKLKDQEKADYEAYKCRATYFNATGRTLDGLVGMVFRKAPVVVMPTAMEVVANDIDLAGTTLIGQAEKVVREVLDVGRVGLLVEFPRVEEQPSTLAQAAAKNLRPYTSTYPAESIINWKAQRVNNVMQLVLVVLMEDYEVSNDGFESKTDKQLRALSLTESGYQQQVYRKKEGGNNKAAEWIPSGGPIIPLINNKPLNFIPFFAFGPNSNDLTMQDPPLLDLVDLNLAHYRVCADYEHGCHFTGLPMLFLAGIELKDGEKVSLGSQTALISRDPNAKGVFIEFTGQGMGALEHNLESKEKQMAAIGARMLEQQKAGVESEGAMLLRSNGETSMLASISNLVSQGFTRMLAFMAEWADVKGDISIKLNTDFMPKGMTSTELAELTKAMQSGAISFETYFENLQRGEIISADKSPEDEKELIAEDGPKTKPGGAENGDD
jgi:hypothetical protein